MKKYLIILIGLIFLVLISYAFFSIHIVSYFASYFLIALMSFFLIISCYKSYKEKNLLEPIMIFNIFFCFIFILRPLNIFLANVIETDYHVFNVYCNIYGVYKFLPSDFSTALLIGLFGQISIYYGYYSYRFSRIRKKHIDTVFVQKKLSSNIFINRLFIFLTIMLMLFFVLRFSNFRFVSFLTMSSNIDFSTLDIIWIHIGTVSILVSIILTKKIGLLKMLLILIMLVLMSSIGQRAYAVNLLLTVIILNYYYIYKRRINIKIVILFVVIIISVLIFGTIRSANIGRIVSGNVFQRILDEFSMFDMLLVSINHSRLFGSFNYIGYNYLAIFNGFFPESIWPFWVNHFDHLHTSNLFLGYYGGAVPTSMFGSLFLNFSIFGVVTVSVLMGVFFKKISYYMLENPSLESLVVYSLFATFIYDLVRVGDFSRELWTFMVYLGVFYIMRFIHRTLKFY